MSRPYVLPSILSLALALPACDRAPAPPAKPSEAAAPATNRVDINPAVRQNLGITLAKVERRNVARTLRIPGSFELLPTARREYRLPAPGRIELLVRQYQSVESGTPLYRLDSPRWREVQRDLTDAHAAVRVAQAGASSIAPFMEAHEKHHAEIQAAVDLWTKRAEKLTKLQSEGAATGDDVAQAQAALAVARTDFSETLEKEAELISRRSQADAALEAATSRLRIHFDEAASLTGLSASDLQTPAGTQPRWQTISQIEVRALSPGVVDSLTAVSGATADQHAPILVTVQPDQVRFRAHALQSDLGKLADGLPAAVVAPQGGSLGASASVPGTLTLAPTADAERRTIELVMTPAASPPLAPLAPWARAGVSAFLEVVVNGSGAEELAIPLACIARDGTQTIIFRRDPADPNKAIRMDADLGIDDGRWIVINSGVAEGNEVVLDGVYQLMVATSGNITKGGHFHSDGSFHEGKD